MEDENTASKQQTEGMPFEPLLWAVLLQKKDYDAGFKDDDLIDLMDMKHEHDEAFKKWCKEHYYAGHDDEMSNDLQWLGKAIKFFVERGYLKNCP